VSSAAVVFFTSSRDDCSYHSFVINLIVRIFFYLNL